MKNKVIVTELKKFDEDSEIKVKINLEKYSLMETCYHNGTWNGYNFSCTSYTNWKRGTLETSEFSLTDLINLLKKKDLNQMGSGDFPSMDVNETTDGSVEVEDIEWDGNPTEEELEDLNKHDLYWDSEITDSEYEFNDGSIWFMEIDVNGEKFSIEN